jgi:hypothetical protein
MPEDAIGEALLELEQRLLEPQVRRNRSSVAALLADDFVEFGSSGRTFDKQQTLELLGSGAEVQLELTGFRARALGSGVVLVTLQSDAPGGSFRARRRVSAQLDLAPQRGALADALPSGHACSCSNPGSPGPAAGRMRR